MDIKKLKQIAGRAAASAGLAYNVGTVPIAKDATPDLIKDMREHEKSLMQQRGAQIRETTIRNYTPTPALDKRTSKKLRK